MRSPTWARRVPTGRVSRTRLVRGPVPGRRSCIGCRTPTDACDEREEDKHHSDEKDRKLGAKNPHGEHEYGVHATLTTQSEARNHAGRTHTLMLMFPSLEELLLSVLLGGGFWPCRLSMTTLGLSVRGAAETDAGNATSAKRMTRKRAGPCEYHEAG